MDLLAALPAPLSERVEAAATTRRYRAGDIVFHEADVGESLHLLRAGIAVVRVTTPQGEVSILNVLRPGSTFGEMALIQPELTRSATVAALTDITTLMLRRSAFDQLRAQHPEVDRFLVLALAQNVQRLSRLLLESHRDDVPHRVRRRLVDLAPDGAVDAYDVPMTQEEFASLVGTTRPSANQALKRLEARGLVVVRRGAIRVVDAPRLRLLSGG